ncbi:MAG: hypothetical protein ABIO70_35450 [Pseudomonadota bacterium]
MSRKSSLRWLTLGFVLLGLGWFYLPDCSPKSPEEQVRAAIQEVADGLGEARLDHAMAPISAAYLDEDGFNAAAVRGILFRELQSRGPIQVILGGIEVEFDPDGEHAEARFNAMLLEGLNPAALDLRANNAEAWAFIVDLALEEGDWRITSHARRDVEPKDIFE